MVYVVITQFYGEKDPKNPYKNHVWPAECREFESVEAAEKACPGRHVMTIQEFNIFVSTLRLALDIIPKPKASWWKFWGK